MRIVASYILKGPVQAILSALVPAVLSISAPFILKLLLIYFCGAAIALVSLAITPARGLMVLLLAITALLLGSQLLGLDSQAMLDIWNSVYLWSSVWIAASLLQILRSLAISLQALGMLAIASITVFYLTVEEPVKLCRELLEPFRQILLQSQAGNGVKDLDVILHEAARILPGSLLTFTVLGAMFSLLIARSWQARLYHPGALQREFQSLRFSKNMGLFMLVLIVALIFSQSLGDQVKLILANSIIVFGLLYAFAGLAIVHSVLGTNDKARFYLIGVYVLLIVQSAIMIPILMTVALTDTWLDYRGRIAAKRSDQ